MHSRTPRTLAEWQSASPFPEYKESPSDAAYRATACARAEEAERLLAKKDRAKRKCHNQAREIERLLANDRTLKEQIAKLKSELAESILEAGKFSIHKYAKWDKLHPSQQLEFQRLTGLKSWDRFMFWVNALEQVNELHRRPSKLSHLEQVSVVFIRLNSGLSWKKLAALLGASDHVLRRNFCKRLEQLAEIATPIVYPEVTEDVVRTWAKATTPAIAEAARRALKLAHDTELCLFLVDGTYHEIMKSKSFVVKRLTYSGNKKYTLLKSHQVATADGSRAFCTLGGGDVDDQKFLRRDVEDKDSQLRLMVDKAIELAYTVVIVLDGGYWEESKEVVRAAGAIPWVKDNQKGVRQPRDKAIEQDTQMVIRSTVERSNANNVKRFDMLSKPLDMGDIFRLEDMLAVAMAESILEGRPLVQPRAGLPRNQFELLSLKDLDQIEKLFALRKGNEKAKFIKRDDVCATLGPIVGSRPDPDAAGAQLPATRPSIFSRTSLTAWISRGRVLRGHSYERLNWISDIEVRELPCHFLIMARSKHSLTSDTSWHLAMRIPIPAKTKSVALKDVATRCSCPKGESGQCGHVMGLALALWHHVEPAAYNEAFRKNPHGKHQPTTEDLESYLMSHFSIWKDSVQTSSDEARVFKRSQTASFSAFKAKLTDQPLQASSVTRTANPGSKAQAQKGRDLRNADKR
jgi:cell division protein FtsB